MSEAEEPDKPSILLLDIETAPILASVWGLFDQNVGLNQIERDWFVMSWCAKWLGQDEIFYADQRKAKDLEDDSGILRRIWELLDQADVVIGHNSKKFDIKKLNARFAIKGMPPPSGFRQIDTLSMARRHFAFTSNKLQYLSEKLCSSKKSEHRKFPGHLLWKACLSGNRSAWREMEAYNKADVVALEELYKKLVPWDHTVNFSQFYRQSTCTCGSRDFQKFGYRFTNGGRYQRFKCRVCGKDHVGKQNLNKLETRRGLLT